VTLRSPIAAIKLPLPEALPVSPTRQLIVAILCSGGDAPGMNALLRALVRLGLNRHGAAVLGIKDGYDGLVRTCRRLAGEVSFAQLHDEMASRPGLIGLQCALQDLVWLDHPSVSGILRRGGTVLGSARCEEFYNPQTRRQVGALLAGLGVGALVVCGGDGSLTGAALLSRECGLPVVGIPVTIDNDLPATDLSLGFDTAVNTVVAAATHFNDTAGSHRRIMVLEVMGRGSGDIARWAALAAGVEIVVIPERGVLGEAKMQRIAQRLEASLQRGRRHAVVLVSEGVRLDPPGEGGPAYRLSAYLQRHFRRDGSPFPRLETRASVLGHLQRGGSPMAADRILAARFAEAAWAAIAGGQVLLQDFDAPARPQQAEAAQQLYLLQKTLSQW
jgi:6-phosphofructokinase 1